MTLPAQILTPDGYIRLEPGDILKETDLVFQYNPFRAPEWTPTSFPGREVLAGTQIYIRRSRKKRPASLIFP